MSRRPVLEEVDDDDIDNLDMDISKFDPNLNTPIAQIPQPSVVRSQDEGLQNPFPNLGGMGAPVAPSAPSDFSMDTKDIVDPNNFTQQERDELAKFQLIYPCYFDINRSHNQGRRVSKEYAVENPLAKTVSDACRFLQLPVLLELDKTHPQDFGNPGRVRVCIKQNGKPTHAKYPTKRAILNAIGSFMQKNPTSLISITQGIVIPQEFKQGFTPEIVPRVKGLPMNTIVPVHSEYTLKHPMTKSIYDDIPETPTPAQIEKPKAKQPKMKFKKIRG